MSCNDCILGETSINTYKTHQCSCVPGLRPGISSGIQPTYIILAETPKDMEIVKQVAFQSSDWKLLFDLAKQSELDIDYAYCTYLIKCKPPKSIPKESFAACRKHLDEEIAKYHPKVILAIGSTVCKYFGLEVNLETVGEAFDVPGIPCKVIPTYHPFYVSNHNPHSKVYKGFQRSLVKVKDLLTGGVSITNKYFHAMTVEDVRKVREEILQYEWFSVDIETTSLDTLNAKIVMVSLGTEDGRAYTIFLDHPKFYHKGERFEVLFELKKILESDNKKVFQHAQYDVKVLWNNGIKVRVIACDTILAHYLLQEDAPARDLEYLTNTYTDLKMSKSEVSKYIKEGRILECPIPILQEYAAKDADATYRLFKKFRVSLIEQGLEWIFFRILMPMCMILCKVENRGIMIDKNKFNFFIMQCENRLEEFSQKINNDPIIIKWKEKNKKKEFNPNSSPQRKEILFGELNCHEIDGDSVNIETLEELYDTYKIKLINDIKEYIKNLEFVKEIKKYNTENNVIYTHYKLQGTKTGRLSSNDVKLDNISKNKEVRGLFVAREHHTLLEVDYSSADFYTLGYSSNDPGILKIAKEDKDIHTIVAANIFNRAEDEITPVQREEVKAAVYGVMNGQSEETIAIDLGIPVIAANMLVSKLKSMFPMAMQYLDRQPEMMKRNGYITNMFGRRRRIPDINSRKKVLSNLSSRQSRNFPIQSGTSDITYLGIINTYKSLRELNANILLITVDSITFEIIDRDLDKAIPIIKSSLENVTDKIKMNVKMKVGKNLGEMTKLSI